MTTPGDVEATQAPEWGRSIMDRYQRPLRAYAQRLLDGNADPARDVVQETFLRLFQQPDAAALNGSLLPWLYTVCRSRALDARRRDKRMRLAGDEPAEIESGATADNPSQAAELADAADHVLRLVAQLPANQQE